MKLIHSLLLGVTVLLLEAEATDEIERTNTATKPRLVKNFFINFPPPFMYENNIPNNWELVNRKF